MMNTRSILLMVLVSGVWSAHAQVKLPAIFSDNMVFQQNSKAAVWGTARAGETVVIRASWGKQASVNADPDGKWRMKVDTPAAGGPFRLNVNGVVIKNVLVGEVWLCSGQSNMQWTVTASANAQQEIASANCSQIRQFETPRIPQNKPVSDTGGQWQVCGPHTVGNFSAVAYYFAKHLHQRLNVPIGLINSSWGGTMIEPWIAATGYADIPALKAVDARLRLTDPSTPEYKALMTSHISELDAWLAIAKQRVKNGSEITRPPECPKGILPIMDQVLKGKHQQPTVLFNGMIAPFVGFGMRGVIWYQGESNHYDAMTYLSKKQALINGWRKEWGIGDFPFYYVQLAPFQYGNDAPNVLPEFWEAQAKALDIKNTGMAVIHDVGNVNDIHPRNKQEVGRRLALIALAKDYNMKGQYSGPVFNSMKIQGRKIRVKFEHAGGGMASRDGQALNWFEILGDGKEYVQANAVVDGDCVIVSSPQVKNPRAVRLGWHKLATPNLMNRAGLPARQFRAGKEPGRDWMTHHVAEAEGYNVLYAIDLAQLGPRIKYNLDNAKNVGGTPTRIAYYLQLKKFGKKSRFVFVSMDAFTKDFGKMGIPTVRSGAVFQKLVTNMTVVSNVEGLTTGEKITGNVEFWPNNYLPTNKKKIPGASKSKCDFGDMRIPDPANGYGSMQVHNTAAKQTLFAINNWNAANEADIGIGNCPLGHKDWTFSKSGAAYTIKRLVVLVKTK